MFSKNKKEVLGIFEDEKGIRYKLVKERQRRLLDKKGEGIEQILFYRGSEAISSWEAPKIKLNLSKSNVEAIQHFINDYLQSSSNIRASLLHTQYPLEGLMTIWNGIYKDNSLIKETLLAYQNVLSSYEFINNLIHQEKWIVLTQNIHRTNENMKVYENMYQEVVTEFLYKYLSKKYIDKYERVYGEWKELITKTFNQFYTEELKKESIRKAIDKTKMDLIDYQNQRNDIKKQLTQMDKEYEVATISQKFKMEESVKELLKKEEEKNEEIQETKEKVTRIECFLEI